MEMGSRADLEPLRGVGMGGGIWREEGDRRGSKDLEREEGGYTVGWEGGKVLHLLP